MKTKGQSILLTHTLLIGLGVIFVFIVISSFASLHEQFQDFVYDKEIQQVCFVLKGGIENVYSRSSYRPPTETIEGNIFLGMPERIAGEPYRARFDGQDAIIESIGRSYTCRIGLDVEYTGSTAGGLTRLVFSRNLTSDTMEMSNA